MFVLSQKWQNNRKNWRDVKLKENSFQTNGAKTNIKLKNI